ncbi:MAG: CapA family protein [Novosphingobium sp.]|nr:CapA family protein [Novosphingobium sp.]
MTGVLIAVGDLAPDRDNYDESYVAAREMLQGADIAFGQLETTFAAGGVRAPQARHAVLARPDGADALARAGFDVISLAGNHVLDWGNDAFFETVANLERAGIRPVGAGANIAEARRPVSFTLEDGSTLALLAYSSILPQSYWADERRPGCAPMRAFTHYEQIEHDQPGTPPRIRSWPHPDDLAALQADIRAAKQEHDVVVVSLHWGIHFVRATIAEYQPVVARAAVEAGADAILGGHAHILKGVEMIDTVPVFYSLCNFACDLRMDEQHAKSKSFNEIRVLAEEWEPDFDSLYNFPKASRLAIAARLEIAGGKVVRSGFVPIHIGRDAVPVPLAPGDTHYEEVIDYLSAVTREAGFATAFHSGPDMVEVQAA